MRREQARAIGYGYRRGENLRRVNAPEGKQPVPAPSSDGNDTRYGNPANPRSGIGMQQARILRLEETVEAVRNRRDGT